MTLPLARYTSDNGGMSSDKPKRPWYQFSLLTLLIAVTLFTVTFGWVGSRMHRAWKNQERRWADDAAARRELDKDLLKIERYDVWVTARYEHQPTWLERLFGDPGVHNGKLRIEVHGKVTDAELKQLKKFTQLTDLSLGHSKVTDAGLEHLKGRTNLKYLDLTNTNITDIGLEHLKGLKSLQVLGLWDTQVTDAGLEHLKGLTNLKYLDLTNTNITDAGTEKLKQALPNCEIGLDTHHHP